MCIVTNHAEERIRERVGVGKKASRRNADLAFTRGIPGNMTKGRLKKWVEYKCEKNKNIDNPIIYGDKIYLFDQEILVTVIQIPAELTKNLKKMIVS